MNEFNFINSIKPKYYRQSSVIKGIGDDAAIVHPPYGEHLVVSTDTMVENVHFSLEYMTLEDIGYRVLAANISDLAAMGSRPLYYIVNISSPTSYDNNELIEIMNGMKSLARDYKMDLIGGDTTSSGQLVITVTVFGSILSHLNRLRSAAKAKDVVFVTGYLGESAYGLEYIKKENDRTKGNYFLRQHVRPVPRIDFTEATSDIDRICLNDISDGLASEINEIAEASNVEIEIEWGKVPIHDEMKKINKDKLKRLALSSGEDFELVGTCSSNNWGKIKKNCELMGIKVTSIGRVLSSTSHSKVYLKDGLSKITLKRNGYQHG